MTLLGGFVLTACPGRPSGDDTDDTSLGDTEPPPSTDTTASTSEPTTTGTSDSPTTDTPPSSDDRQPHEGPWEVVVDALPFPLADIRTLTVGGKEFNENFANRGVVEVLFDHDEETITVETRKYTFGDTLDVENGFERLFLWAFVLTDNPTPHPDPADDCTLDTWKDGCAILAYYDGKAQPERLGMDLRVHLPRGYRGELLVATEDNITEQSWPRRGDVTLHDFCGTGEVALEAGRAKIRLCRDLSPAPTCPPENVQACASWPDGTGSEAWSPDCPCGPELFGQLLVRAPQPWAANLVVDVPGDAWLNATAQNIEVMRPHDCRPTISACADDNCMLNADDEFAPTAEFSHPSPAAPAGAGYNVLVVSGACTKIPFVDPGDPWTPDQTPPEELRGLVDVCTDCL